MLVIMFRRGGRAGGRARWLGGRAARDVGGMQRRQVCSHAGARSINAVRGRPRGTVSSSRATRRGRPRQGLARRRRRPPAPRGSRPAGLLQQVDVSISRCRPPTMLMRRG